MKRIFLLMLVFMSLAACAQTTPSYKNVKLTQLPLGTKNDSIVLTNGSTKLLKYIPVSQIKVPTNLDYTATPTGGTVFSSTGNDAVIPLATTMNAGLFSPTDKTTIDGVQSALDLKANDADVLHKTGNETKTGTLTINNPVGGGSYFTGTQSGSGADRFLIKLFNNGGVNSAALRIDNQSDAYGINLVNTSTGIGSYIGNNSAGTGFKIDNSSTGVGFILNNGASATGYPFVVAKSNVVKSYINDSGDVNGAKFVKSGGTSSQFLKADGSVDSVVYAPLDSPTFTGSVQVPNATLSTQAVNKSQLDAVVAKTYKTYFINTSTGVNATGVYEDPSKPYLTIDYVLALPALKNGDIIYLQNAGNFPLNGQIPYQHSLHIKSDAIVTLNFSGNNNSNLIVDTNTQYPVFTIDIPYGEIYNERSGGAGVNYFISSGGGAKNIRANSIYWNCSNPFISHDGPQTVNLEVNKISVKTVLFNSIRYSSKEIFIPEFNCLGVNASLAGNCDQSITINKITGIGSFFFNRAPIFNIGTIATSQISNIGDYGSTIPILINFRNSVITGGLEIGSYYGGYVVLSGNIVSVDMLRFSGNEHSWRTLKLLNFSADIGTNTLNVFLSDITVENTCLKSTNTPFLFNSYVSGKTLTLKNSSFEVVNSVQLVNGAPAGANACNVKISGISTNATSITTSPNITVTQFTNY